MWCTQIYTAVSVVQWNISYKFHIPNHYSFLCTIFTQHTHIRACRGLCIGICYWIYRKIEHSHILMLCTSVHLIAKYLYVKSSFYFSFFFLSSARTHTFVHKWMTKRKCAHTKTKFRFSGNMRKQKQNQENLDGISKQFLMKPPDSFVFLFPLLSLSLPLFQTHWIPFCFIILLLVLIIITFLLDCDVILWPHFDSVKLTLNFIQ